MEDGPTFFFDVNKVLVLIASDQHAPPSPQQQPPPPPPHALRRSSRSSSRSLSSPILRITRCVSRLRSVQLRSVGSLRRAAMPSAAATGRKGGVPGGVRKGYMGSGGGLCADGGCGGVWGMCGLGGWWVRRTPEGGEHPVHPGLEADRPHPQHLRGLRANSGTPTSSPPSALPNRQENGASTHTPAGTGDPPSRAETPRPRVRGAHHVLHVSAPQDLLRDPQRLLQPPHAQHERVGVQRQHLRVFRGVSGGVFGGVVVGVVGVSAQGDRGE